MILIGFILLVLGLIFGIGLLVYIGVALMVVGAVLYFTGARGPVRGHWY